MQEYADAIFSELGIVGKLNDGSFEHTAASKEVEQLLSEAADCCESARKALRDHEATHHGSHTNDAGDDVI